MKLNVNFKMMILSLALGISTASAATPAGDATASIVKDFETTYKNVSVKTIALASLKAQLWVTESAQTLMTTRQFDVEDTAFDQEIFLQYVAETFLWSLNQYQSSVGSSVTEVHLTLNDLGEDRKSTVCETFVNTRFMHCDLRRIHKMFKGYRAFLLPMVLVHEFTHVNQYFNMGYPIIESSSTSDAGRILAHGREFKAISVEIAAMIQHDGEEIAFSNYGKMLKGACTPALFSLEDENLLKQTGRRCLILTLWTLIHSNLAEANTSIPQPDLMKQLMLKTNQSLLAGFEALKEAAKSVGLIRTSDKAPIDFVLLKQEAILQFPIVSSSYQYRH